MVRLGDLELSPIDGHTFRAPWLCRLHEARDYGDRHQYCPLGLTSFGMRSRPVRCSPCTAQVNSVDRPAPALSTAKSSPVLNSARQSGCSSVGRCTTCPRFGRCYEDGCTPGCTRWRKRWRTAGPAWLSEEATRNAPSRSENASNAKGLRNGSCPADG